MGDGLVVDRHSVQSTAIFEYLAGRCIYPEKMVAKHFWLQMEQ